MRRFYLLAAVLLIVGGCSNTPSKSASTSPSAQAVSASPVAASVVPGGCGSTQLYRAGIPQWIDEATGHNTPDFLPYAIANPPIAAGFIFGYPLRAGHPYPNNKILWVVGKPRNGSPLEITGQLSGANQPSVHESEPADSSPGEIYPSIVDVPQPGCWRFDLAWSGNHAAVYLEYQ